jgi:hypothetical protein
MTAADKKLLAQVREEYDRLIAEIFTASVKEHLAFQREVALNMRPPHRH